MGFLTRTLYEALLLAAIGALPSIATAKATIRDLGRTVDVGNITYYIPGNAEVFHPCPCCIIFRAQTLLLPHGWCFSLPLRTFYPLSFAVCVPGTFKAVMTRKSLAQH